MRLISHLAICVLVVLYLASTACPQAAKSELVAGAAGFGSITSAGDPRVLQFGLKVNF